MKCLVTGGKGFLGSNLAHALLEKGYEVTVLDVAKGGNFANIADISKDLKFIVTDIRDRAFVKEAVQGQDVVFHLAGQVSHIVSQEDPYYDLDVNLNGILNILEACVQLNPKVHLIFASSRSVYGFPEYLPVDEKHPTNPIDAYGVTKLASEKYVNLYHYHHDLKTTIMRMANLFGPRQQLHTRVYQMVSWVFKCAMLKEPLSFYGDGEQTRDFLYVGDAVRAYVKAAEFPYSVEGKTYNLCGLTYCTWNEVMKTASKVTGNPITVNYEEYPALRKKLENPHHRLNGDAIMDDCSIQPKVTLEEGFREMLEYYWPERYKEYI